MGELPESIRQTVGDSLVHLQHREFERLIGDSPGFRSGGLDKHSLEKHVDSGVTVYTDPQTQSLWLFFRRAWSKGQLYESEPGVFAAE